MMLYVSKMQLTPHYHFFSLFVPILCSSGFSLDYKDDSVESLSSLREQLNDPDPSVLYKTCSELTKVMKIIRIRCSYNNTLTHLLRNNRLL